MRGGNIILSFFVHTIVDVMQPRNRIGRLFYFSAQDTSYILGELKYILISRLCTAFHVVMLAYNAVYQ